MKSLYLGLICLLIVSACKSDTPKTPTTEQMKELTIAEKIANAHGFKNWKNVSEIKFTFQVDRDTIKGNGRSWIWQPKTDNVIMTTSKDTISYNRSKIDSTHINTDSAFINDKFWLLIPLQLVWDTSATISEAKTVEAPISKTKMSMITLTYSDEGGYTPGDAYDIYFDDNYTIKEWVYRKGNSATPTMATTFENHKVYNGIKIATDHKMDNGNWNLNFTDVTITLDE